MFGLIGDDTGRKHEQCARRASDHEAFLRTAITWMPYAWPSRQRIFCSASGHSAPWVDGGRFGDLEPCQSLSTGSDFSSKWELKSLRLVLESAPSMRLWWHTSLFISRLFQVRLLRYTSEVSPVCACVNSQAFLFSWMFQACACGDAQALASCEYSSMSLRRHTLSRFKGVSSLCFWWLSSFANSHLENLSIMRLQWKQAFASKRVSSLH